MKTNTKTILSIMNVLSWIAFIGLCIKTGAILFTTIMSLFFNPLAAKDLYLGLDLSELYKFGQWQYICLLSLIIFLSGYKAYFFFLITRIFPKINLAHPFSASITSLLVKISCAALWIGILTYISIEYIQMLGKKGIGLPDLNDFFGGAEEFLFMAGIIFIIAQVFKRGLEIQSENELTV